MKRSQLCLTLVYCSYHFRPSISRTVCSSVPILFFFFFNDPAPPEISPLPHPDPLPISGTTQLGVRQVFDGLDDPDDPLPASLRTEPRLLGLGAALRAVHRSDNRREIAAAQRRLKW